MYDIEITYTTGNSFNTYTETDVVCVPVETLAEAKVNLQRIKQHWSIYQQKHGYSLTVQDIDYPDFYIGKSDGIILKTSTEEGQHEIMHPFWVGYFESLISAKIVELKDEDDELEFVV